MLHQRGRPAEAAALFEEAERLQKEMQPVYPRLYSLSGFRYCDLLLEQGQEAEVLARAAQTLEWARAHLGLLDIALDHLSLGRAHLRPAQRGAGADLPQAATHLDQAVEGLRRAGTKTTSPAASSPEPSCASSPAITPAPAPTSTKPSASPPAPACASTRPTPTSPTPASTSPSPRPTPPRRAPTSPRPAP